MPRQDHQKAPMIPRLPIHTITINPRSTGIHDILRHVCDPGEIQGYLTSTLKKKEKLG